MQQTDIKGTQTPTTANAGVSIPATDSTATLQVTDSGAVKAVADSLRAKNSKIAKHSYTKKVDVELTGTRGVPVPYNIAGDNLITCLLIICFIVATTAFTRASNVFFRNAKSFFFVQRGLTTVKTETTREFRFLLGLIAETCLVFALVFFFYVRENVAETFVIPHYQVIGIFTLVLMVYFALRTLLYTLINWVFFDKKGREQWMRANVFVMGVEGLLLLPLVMLYSYFNISTHLAIAYVVIVVCLIKMSGFYKSYLIFFNKRGYWVQNVLYFCALELTPLVGLWEMLMLISDSLKTNI